MLLNHRNGACYSLAVLQRLECGHHFVLVFGQFFINRMLLLQVIVKRLLGLPVFSMSLLHLIDAVYYERPVHHQTPVRARSR